MSGIEVLNPVNGAMLINDKFANIALIEKGSVTTTSGYASGSKGTIIKASGSAIPTNGNYLVAIHSGSYQAAVVMSYHFATGGGNFGFQSEFYCSGPVGTIVTYYLFVEPQFLPTPSNVGMEVFHSVTLERIFHSDYKYMRLVNIETPANIGSFTYSPSRQYAFATASASSRIVAKGSPANLRDVYTKAVNINSSNRASASEFWLVNGTLADTRVVATYDNFMFMAIDVTGY